MKKIRAKTRDVALQYRMGAGFPGDVNRTHPASIEPCLIDSNAPPTAFGQPVLVDQTTQGVRPFSTADHSDTVAAGYGVTVRPFPFQQASTGAAAAGNFGATTIGSGAPPATGVIDILRAGYIIVNLPAGGTPSKGDPVYVWANTASGSHVVGGVEAAASSGNTVPLKNAYFNGHPDANGNVEIGFNI